MKKRICILLALCLTLCAVLYMPAMAADEEDGIQPLSNGSLWQTVTDQEGYRYRVYGTTIIAGTSALVSTEYYLTDHQIQNDSHRIEIAAQVKGLSAYTDLVTYNSATDSFGGTGFYVGVSNKIQYTRSYSYLVMYMNGLHGFGCNGVPDYKFYTLASQ